MIPRNVYFYFGKISKMIKMLNKICKRLLKVITSQFLKIFLFVFIVSIFFIGTFKTFRAKSDLSVIVWWTTGFPGTSETRHCPKNLQCEVISSRHVDRNKVGAYLFYGSNISFEDLPVPRYRHAKLWGLYHEESPRNVEELMHEEILNLFNYSSTFSRKSNVPFPLQYLDSIGDITNTDFFVDTATKNSYLKELAPIMYLQTDCETSTQRDIYVKELMKYIPIDSYGACLNNKHLPQKFKQDYLNNLGDEGFLNFIARYKFVIAIENGVCIDYVTEKFWRAIKVGTVPIYFGDPSIRDWLPNQQSALLLEDYPTPKAMSDQIKRLLGDDHLYEQYLEHKTMQIITNRNILSERKQREYQFDTFKTIAKFECFICRKLHENKRRLDIVTKKHYDCPKPISALTLSVNKTNTWVYSWDTSKRRVKKILKNLT